MNAKALLKELIAIPSVSVETNGPIISCLEKKCVELGFKVERQEWKENGVPKMNLIARRGDGRDGLALVGHTDTVPFDPSWKNATTPIEQDGRIIGRGSCDTKGFIACALAAAHSTKDVALEHPLTLIFTADEEIGCLGAQRLTAEMIGAPRYAIVGEPTSLTPIRGNKGYCLATVTITGKEGHSAYPDTGASAINAAARMITDLKRLADGLREDGDSHFSPPFTTINVGVINGGKAKNIIAGHCEFMVEWRPIPRQPLDGVLDALLHLADDVAQETGTTVRVGEPRLGAGFETAAASPLVKFLEKETGRKAQTVPFGTEGPELTDLGVECVVLGPGDITNAHQTGEFVPIEDLKRCTAVLHAAIQNFCASGRKM